MAYAVIHFLEGTDPKATVCRLGEGQPSGENGVMNLLGEFVNEWSPTVMREGSPGAIRIAMLFTAQEQEAGREVRVLGGEGPLGITAEEVQGLEGEGYMYEVNFGAPGERSLPAIRSRAIGRPNEKME